MPGKQNGPVKNSDEGGHTRFVNFDPDDPEYVKDLQRPAVIKEDMNEMERRKRVREILESKPFRKELETLIVTERAAGNDPAHLLSLEALSELVLPRGQLAAANLHGMSAQAIVPIADLRGAEGGKYSKQERILRNKLASLYRLIDLFQWSQGIYNHVTLRVNPESDELLINPFGLLYHEISASSLIRVNLDGEVLEGGSTGMGVNDTGYALHAAIHRARPDLRCVIHLHTPVVGAVAAMKCGLLNISQEAMSLGEISYHDYKGVVSEEEKEAIAQDLKPNSKVMLLRNHGCVIAGPTIEEAFDLAYNTVLACETQVLFMRGDGFICFGESVEEAFYTARCLVQACEQQIRAARAGLENLVIANEESAALAAQKAKVGGGNVLRSPDKEHPGHKIRWRTGELEWEAWMRVLDNAGFRTGHVYRQPMLRGKGTPMTPQSDVEAPPASSSYGALDEVDSTVLANTRLEQMRREQEKTRWLNSPNSYQKVEFLESGTSEPKKITKWVVDPTSPSHSTSVKITDSHQFSPVSLNSKEFKTKQKAIKEARRVGEISAGPQSKVMEGVTYEEIEKLKDAEMSGASEMMTIGTASKGIIERDFQHNAQVYRQLYAPNPFASETDEDIQKYMAEVQLKQTPSHGSDPRVLPGSPAETESPSAETISLMQAARDHRRMTSVDEEEPPSADSTLVPAPAPTPTQHATNNKKGYTRETTFDLGHQVNTRITEKKASSIGGVFGRSRSERVPKSQRNTLGAGGTIHEGGRAASDDELKETVSPKKEKKKKKFKAPSFLRSKKDKKKEEA